MFDPRPWGTLDLSPIYPNHRFTETIGEAWLTGDACKVANGIFQGKSLADLSRRFGPELLGDAAPDPHRFPLLLKFLFPHDKLSVQVHPDDASARSVGQLWGKTECWYVVQAKPGSQVALGLKEGVSASEFEHAIHHGHAETLLHWTDVYAGEMIYVAGGTVHTLGPGSILLETQQQSDTTYRLYDYGRPRELHLKQGLAAVKQKVASGKVIRPAPAPIAGTKNRHSSLIEAPYFVVDQFELHQIQEFATVDEWGKRSAQIVAALEGCAIIESAGCEPMILGKGDLVVVPASADIFHIRPQWSVELLKAYVPGIELPEPRTRI
jgi:mannose-6-phosphate isomerase